MWLFYTLLAAVLWGIGQIFVKKGLKDTSALFNNVLSCVLGFLIFVPFALSHQVNFDKFWQLAPFTAFISFLYFSYYYAIGKGQLALTGTVIGTYPLVTVILSLLFLGENPSAYQKIAIGVIILGTIFVALPNKAQKFKMGSWLLWALLVVCMTGTAEFLIKLLLNQHDLYTYLFTYGISTLFVASLFWLFDKKGRVLPAFTLNNYMPTLIGVGMIEVGFFIFHLALNEGLVSLITPISSIYVAITAILAWIILKEKINKTHALGIALATVGVILIGIV